MSRVGRELRRIRRAAAAALASRGPDDARCSSVWRWVLANQGTERHEVLPPLRVTRALPRTIEPQIHPVYTAVREQLLPAKYVVPVHGARLVGQGGLVVLPDGRVATEVEDPGLLDRDAGYRAFRAGRVDGTVSRAGAHVSLVATFPSVYYHWLHDGLLRLYGVAEQLPPDTTYVIPANPTPFQRETLRVLGIRDEQTVEFSGDEVWELETLYFLSPTSFSGSDRAEADRWLRDGLYDAYGIEPGPAQRRIFVSRRHQRRRLVNEAATEDLLRGYGFETLIPEDLSLRDQVARFAQASVVVSTHGSAFTNILFAPTGLTVVDMIDSTMIKFGHAFWSLADALGHRYWYFEAESVARGDGPPDTRVAIEKLAATIDQLGLDRSA